MNAAIDDIGEIRLALKAAIQDRRGEDCPIRKVYDSCHADLGNVKDCDECIVNSVLSALRALDRMEMHFSYMGNLKEMSDNYHRILETWPRPIDLYKKNDEGS